MASSRAVLADSVRPVVCTGELGVVDFVPMDYQLCDEVQLEATPWHTPSHVSVRIASAGNEALITGDCTHHPCQGMRTDWCSSADYDQAEGHRTRELLLGRVADTDLLVIGTHFATPAAGRVRRRTEGGYWLDVG